jgi:hypothetical protein
MGISNYGQAVMPMNVMPYAGMINAINLPVQMLKLGAGK